MDQERETQRKTYQLCRLGFAILSLSLLLASADAVLALMAQFGARSFVIWINNQAWWRWVGTPIVWGSLLGTYLLWGRWSDTGWQRRAGLLVVMNMVDAILWTLDHGNDLGLRLEDVGHHWFRSNLGQALGWAEFTLIASLAGDVMAHLGVEQAREASKSTRSLAATGALVWMVLFYHCTAWKRGWPLEGPRNVRSLETILLYLGSTMIWTITLIQVTALSIAATRETSRALAEMDLEDESDDLFPSPSDSHADLLPTLFDRSHRDSPDSRDRSGG
jgi:hypothetical protein